MVKDYFGWSSDANGDGVPETLRYSTTLWLPSLETMDTGRAVTTETVGTLDGGIFTLTRTRSGRYDHASPGRIVLVWGMDNPVDPDFLPILDEDHARNRLVSVRMDYHWRQLEVASSGLADRKLTVNAGWLLTSTGRAWLSSDTIHTCSSATHTKVYVTASSGSLTVGSGTSVPGGSTQIATISITGDVVSVTSDPSGTPNARTCKILSFDPRPIGDNLATCEVVLQEQE